MTTICDLIQDLANPHLYPENVDRVQLCQTHISVVALAGDYAYKIKKPVNFGFLDFSTLEKRHHFCLEEMRLNRRLAPQVYLNVVPLTMDLEGLTFEGTGEVVEWAVKMQRLPDNATLKAHLRDGRVDAAWMRSLAQKLAHFHQSARRGEEISQCGSLDVIAGNARENFEQAQGLVGVTVHESVFQRVQTLTEECLDQLAPLMEKRAREDVPCETHGDLRLDHVYFFPDREPPDDLAIIDCIEFNERFRYADPIADLAFLIMDLHFHGHRDLGDVLLEEYVRASGDEQGRELLPFYLAYRAIVRAKVEGFELQESEVPQEEKEQALQRARAYWLLALRELEEPNERPGLVLLAGLPGVGKSTLARGLCQHSDWEVIRSDVVRKELAGVSADEALPEEFYDSTWTRRTYDGCLRRTEQMLFEGKRVILDANLRREDQRIPFVRLARKVAVPIVLAHCHGSPEVIRERLKQRSGDASDADWETYQKLLSTWEPFSEATLPMTREIRADGTPEETLHSTLHVLEEVGLASL